MIISDPPSEKVYEWRGQLGQREEKQLSFPLLGNSSSMAEMTMTRGEMDGNAEVDKNPSDDV